MAMMKKTLLAAKEHSDQFPQTCKSPSLHLQLENKFQQLEEKRQEDKHEQTTSNHLIGQKKRIVKAFYL